MVEDSFAELARLCFRACHLLSVAARGRDLDTIDGLGQKIEDLEMYVDRFNSTQFPKLTREIRIMCRIESTLRERVNCLRYSKDCDPGRMEEFITAWQTELCGILSFFAVRYPFTSCVRATLFTDTFPGIACVSIAYQDNFRTT
jgi:hypothetical protein